MMETIIVLLIAILMGMGIGGGGFLVIYLTLCLNFEQIIAQGVNLAFFVICGSSAILVHSFRRKINPCQLGIMISFGALGAYLSSLFVDKIDQNILRVCLGALLIVSGVAGVIRLILDKKTDFNRN